MSLCLKVVLSILLWLQFLKWNDAVVQGLRRRGLNCLIWLFNFLQFMFRLDNLALTYFLLKALPVQLCLLYRATQLLLWVCFNALVFCLMRSSWKVFCYVRQYRWGRSLLRQRFPGMSLHCYSVLFGLWVGTVRLLCYCSVVASGLEWLYIMWKRCNMVLNRLWNLLGLGRLMPPLCTGVGFSMLVYDLAALIVGRPWDPRAAWVAQLALLVVVCRRLAAHLERRTILSDLKKWLTSWI